MYKGINMLDMDIEVTFELKTWVRGKKAKENRKEPAAGATAATMHTCAR